MIQGLEVDLAVIAGGAKHWHRLWSEARQTRRGVAQDIRSRLAVRTSDNPCPRLMLKAALYMLRRDGLLPPNPRRT